MSITDPIYLERTRWGTTLRQGPNWFWDRETFELMVFDTPEDARAWLRVHHPRIAHHYTGEYYEPRNARVPRHGERGISRAAHEAQMVLPLSTEPTRED